MKTDELLIKFDTLTTEWTEKQVKLEAFIDRWLAGENILSNNQVQQVVDDTTLKISNLKKEANLAIQQYNEKCILDAKEKQKKEEAKKAVIKNFGTNPDEIIITGGILSQNASESVLIGTKKSDDLLTKEMESALEKIKQKVLFKEISASEASDLAEKVRLVYGHNQNSIDESKTILK
jgi:hypothetical protein